MTLETLFIPGVLTFFCGSVSAMRIWVSGSTSATKSLSSSVSVILLWIESNDMNEVLRTNKCDQSVICETEDSQC